MSKEDLIDAKQQQQSNSYIVYISNDEIMLKDGTVAYRTDIEWTMKNNKSMITNLLSAYKNGKCIYRSKSC